MNMGDNNNSVGFGSLFWVVFWALLSYIQYDGNIDIVVAVSALVIITSVLQFISIIPVLGIVGYIVAYNWVLAWIQIKLVIIPNSWILTWIFTLSILLSVIISGMVSLAILGRN